MKKNCWVFLTPFQKNFLDFFSSKKLIWVLKRTLLTSWIRFSILKIHYRLLCIRKSELMKHIYRLLRMFLIRVLNDLQWIFLYRKTYSACQESSFKYPYWHFQRKKINFFFQLITLNLLKNSIVKLKSTKMTFGCVFDYFQHKSPILGTLSTFKKFSCAPLNLSRQGASFKYPYDYIWSDKIFNRKSDKIGRNSKILSESF